MDPKRIGGLALALLLGGCATNPVAKPGEWHGVSEAQERKIGAANYVAYQQAEGGAYTADPAVVAYVRQVAKALWSVSDRPRLPYDVVVLNNSLPNAWAIPGGKLAVNRGLLTELRSEAELASVLAHVIVHVVARHGATSQERDTLPQASLPGVGLAMQGRDYEPVAVAGSGVVAGLTSIQFSRREELQADKYGLAYLSRAGYDLQLAVTLQEWLVSPPAGQDPGWLAGWLAAHPPSLERVAASRAAVPQYPAGGRVGRDAYTNALAGLLRAKPAYAKYDEGCRALVKRQAATALALAQEALAIEPREARFHGLAAKAYAQQQAWDSALDSLNAAIARDGRYFEYYVSRGQLYHERGNLVAARADLTRSLTLLPTATAHYLLGAMDLDRGDTPRAVEHFRAAAESPSDEGRKAAVVLAQLELPEHPERYLRVEYVLDAKGYLILVVENASPVDVGTCVLGVATKSARWWERHAFPQGLPARRVSRLTTRLGPFASQGEAQASVEHRFEEVSLAGGSPAAESNASRSR